MSDKPAPDTPFSLFRELAEMDDWMVPVTRYGNVEGHECFFCRAKVHFGYITGITVEHEPTCLYVRARALLASTPHSR